MTRRRGRILAIAASAALATTLAACGSSDTSATDTETGSQGSLTVYSGRNEALIGELIVAFEQETGIDVEVRYGTTAELAAQLLEEGDASPADVYFSQDAGALQAVSDAGLLAELPQSDLDRVDAIYRAESGTWVGTSGRARVLTYNTDLVAAADLPDSVLDLTDPTWKGKVGWAPTNASFQSFVTALRITQGEAAAEQWLTAMAANGTRSFESNSEIREAVDAGTIALGLTNHYYLYEKIAEVGADGVNSANHYLAAGDPGSLVNVAGVGILASSDAQEQAQRFVSYLLSPAGQQYFVDETAEYPLTADVEPSEALRPLAEVKGPDITLGELSDVAATQELLTRLGLI